MPLHLKVKRKLDAPLVDAAEHQVLIAQNYTYEG